MKKILIIASILLNVAAFSAASVIWFNLDNVLKTMFEARTVRLHSQFDTLSTRPVKVVFVGDSITQGGLWNELFPGVYVANRGIGGNTTSDILARMDQVIKLNPEKLFVMVGVNDLNYKLPTNVAIKNYSDIFNLVDKNLPKTQVYIQSVLPVNDKWKMADNTHIPELNAALKSQADQRGYTYIDLHTSFLDTSGQLRANLSNDGIHLLGTGYELWRREILKFVRE